LQPAGQATIIRVKAVRSRRRTRQPAPDLGSAENRNVYGLVDELANGTVADEARARFAPTVMAQDLAASVELLSAAIAAIPADRLNQSDAERLVASLKASVEAMRQIGRHLRRSI
jgi:hypothetical protein